MPVPVPVEVLRLPRGPDGCSRGFSPNSPRFQALWGGGAEPELTQKVRAELRQRYLKGLGAARGLPTRFWLRAGVQIDAVFGAADVGAVAVQVDSLRTPLGVQEAALLRGQDIIAFSFLLQCPKTPGF